MRKYLLAAASALAFASPAAALDNSWYVGVEGGAMIVEDTEFDYTAGTNRLDDAVAFSRKRLILFNNYYTLDSHGFVMLQAGRYEEAIAYFKKAIAIEGIRYPRMLGWMGAAYAKSGNPHAAQEIIKEFKSRFRDGDGGSISFFIAVVYAAMNNKPEALKWLNTAYEQHDMEMPWIMTEPQFYGLHDEPEFKRIAKAVGY